MKTELRKFIKKLRGEIKQSDLLFSLRRNFIDKDLKRERKNMKKCTLKSKKQIAREIKDYKDHWKCIPHDYIRYGLFDKQLTREEILDYIPMHYYYCDFYNEIFADIEKKSSREDYIKEKFPLTHQILNSFPTNVYKAIGKGRNLSDKLLQYLMFKEKNIPVPTVSGVIYADKVYDTHGKETNFKNILDKLSHSKKIFLKPTDGCGGSGITVLINENGIFKHNGKQVNSLSDLNLNGAQVYIAQEALSQHKDLAAINSSSVNTLRTIVRYADGQPEIIGIILRMGRKDSHVDNSHMGGFSVGIDLKDGKFFKQGGHEHGGGVYDRHPDTGYIFNGNGISDWSQTISQIKEIVSKINEYPLSGWDIAIGKDGIKAIEFNMGFGIEHAQTILGGMRRQLLIK